jgi:hypothetical protein
MLKGIKCFKMLEHEQGNVEGAVINLTPPKDVSEEVYLELLTSSAFSLDIKHFILVVET